MKKVFLGVLFLCLISGTLCLAETEAKKGFQLEGYKGTDGYKSPSSMKAQPAANSQDAMAATRTKNQQQSAAHSDKKAALMQKLAQKPSPAPAAPAARKQTRPPQAVAPAARQQNQAAKKSGEATPAAAGEIQPRNVLVH